MKRISSARISKAYHGRPITGADHLAAATGDSLNMIPKKLLPPALILSFRDPADKCDGVSGHTPGGNDASN